jgi:Rieske Fe-S protein
VGGAALLQTPSGVFLVSRTATDQFSAASAVCTHEGCTVTGFASNTYVCPCHGSRFTTQGGVVSGPASRPLQRFTTSFANNVLTIAI